MNNKLQLDIFDTYNFNLQTIPKGNWEPIEVSFRDIIKEISDTNYLTHSIYYYPAKFIPQVVRFCLNEFTNVNDTVLDPFAGSGTVGLEAYLTERNSILLDLNYLLEVIIPVKIYGGKEQLSQKILYEKIKIIQNGKENFVPNYGNIKYWYDNEIFETLSRYWGELHKLEENIYKFIIQAALVKISKLFSFAEHRTPKLFKSKFKKTFIDELLNANWKKQLDDKLLNLSGKYLSAINRFIKKTEKHSNFVEYYAGVDSAKFNVPYSGEINAIITSPPYLQAQEYIRTAKLDLFWLGYSEDEIKSISKLEIPYRKAEKIVRTETLDEIRNNLTSQRLTNVLNSYFDFTIAALERNMNLLKKNGKACIFVGNPKIDGKEVKTWRILAEYFTARGFQFEMVFDDEIKNRQLFGKRNNKNPDGMKSEYLLILSKQ